MQRWLLHFTLTIGLAMGSTLAVNAQRQTITLSGFVFDSLTLSPLPYVTVVNQTRSNGTTTDEFGSFRLSANPGDSILFTILGYSRKKKVIREGETTLMIFLREFALTLSPVTVYGSYKPQGSDQWKSVIEVPGFIRNPAGPGSGYVVETFGPGVSIGGLITRLTKSEKEKKKLNSVREKAKQSETYLSVIMSDDTKRYFQETFSMSEDAYNKFIESFNINHPEAVFIQSRDEIMKLMVAFAATKK